jgi:predicted membrane GTPase involved in stress response
MIIEPGIEVYEGMLIGIHSRDNDLVVNVSKVNSSLTRAADQMKILF